MENLNIIIGFPSGGMNNDNFTCSLAMIMYYTALNNIFSFRTLISLIKKEYMINLGIIKHTGPMPQKTRHLIVKKAKKLNADKILFLDSDMSFPPDTLIRLLSHNKKIVGCDYTKRMPPIHSLAVGMDDKPIKEKEGLIKVKKIPSGCLLIDMSVFNQIGEPYFDNHWDKNKQDFVGIDYDFCEKVRGYNYDIWCDLDLSQKIIHYGEMGYRL